MGEEDGEAVGRGVVLGELGQEHRLGMVTLLSTGLNILQKIVGT